MAQCLEARPDQSAVELLIEFQARYPGHYSRSHLRTLRRRLQVWRREAIQRLISKMQDHTQDVGSGATGDDHRKRKSSSAAVGVRLPFALRLVKPPQIPQDRASPVTSLVRHPVTKLRDAIRRVTDGFRPNSDIRERLSSRSLGFRSAHQGIGVVAVSPDSLGSRRTIRSPPRSSIHRCQPAMGGQPCSSRTRTAHEVRRRGRSRTEAARD
jgi:hypothetical protein